MMSVCLSLCICLCMSGLGAGFPSPGFPSPEHHMQSCLQPISSTSPAAYGLDSMIVIIIFILMTTMPDCCRLSLCLFVYKCLRS